MAKLVMVVDDSDDARTAIRDILIDEGYGVVEASGGRNALHYLTSDQPPPAIIIADLRMPDINGWDLIKILQSYLRLSNIPVVVVSGTDPGQQQNLRVARFLRKPFDAGVLLDTVARLTSEAEPLQHAKAAAAKSVH